MDFYQICVLVVAIAFVVLVVFAVRALLQITRTAEAAEYLVLSAAAKVEKTEQAFELVDQVASFANSGFFKALKAGADLINLIRKK